MTRPDTSNTELRQGGGSVTPNESPQTVTIYPKNYVTTTSCGHTIELDNSEDGERIRVIHGKTCLLYTSPSPRDATLSRMPSSA